MRKFTVMAAHNAMSRKPDGELGTHLPDSDRQLITFLASGAVHDTPVRHVVQAGLRVGFVADGKPEYSSELYWNQSTSSKTGMTGNCCTMIVCSLSMIECCVAELVVEPYWFNSASTAGLEKRSQFDGAGEPIAAEFFEYNHWRIS